MAQVAYANQRCNVGLANGTIVELSLGEEYDPASAVVLQHPGLFYLVDVGGGGSGASVVDAMNSTQQVINTVTETTVATLVLPAASVSADSLVRIRASGNLLSNDGSTRIHTYRLKANGTTIMTTAKSQAASGNTFAWDQVWTISFAGTSEQNISYVGHWAGAASTAGNSGFSVAGSSHVGWNETALNMAVEVTFTLTIEQAVAASTVYDNVFFAALELFAPLA